MQFAFPWGPHIDQPTQKLQREYLVNAYPPSRGHPDQSCESLQPVQSNVNTCTRLDKKTLVICF